MKPKSIFIIVLLILLGIIILQNTEVAIFQLLFWKIEMSRALLVPIIFIMGLITGYLIALILARRNK